MLFNAGYGQSYSIGYPTNYEVQYQTVPVPSELQHTIYDQPSTPQMYNVEDDGDSSIHSYGSSVADATANAQSYLNNGNQNQPGYSGNPQESIIILPIKIIQVPKHRHNHPHHHHRHHDRQRRPLPSPDYVIQPPSSPLSSLVKRSQYNYLLPVNQLSPTPSHFDDAIVFEDNLPVRESYNHDSSPQLDIRFSDTSGTTDQAITASTTSVHPLLANFSSDTVVTHSEVKKSAQLRSLPVHTRIQSKPIHIETESEALHIEHEPEPIYIEY